MSYTAFAEKRVSQTQESTKLPLPLELTAPISLATPLKEAIEESYRVHDIRYNPKTLVREDVNGVPLIVNFGTKCMGICGTRTPGGIRSDRDMVRDD